MEDERERKLVIKDCPLEAEGKFTCKTNTDETECKLRVTPENEFLKGLEDQEVNVKEQVIFECQMGDEEADAEWIIAGQTVTEDDR